MPHWLGTLHITTIMIDFTYRNTMTIVLDVYPSWNMAGRIRTRRICGDFGDDSTMDRILEVSFQGCVKEIEFGWHNCIVLEYVA